MPSCTGRSEVLREPEAPPPDDSSEPARRAFVSLCGFSGAHSDFVTPCLLPVPVHFRMRITFLLGPMRPCLGENGAVRYSSNLYLITLAAKKDQRRISESAYLGGT